MRAIALRSSAVDRCDCGTSNPVCAAYMWLRKADSSASDKSGPCLLRDDGRLRFMEFVEQGETGEAWPAVITAVGDAWLMWLTAHRENPFEPSRPHMLVRTENEHVFVPGDNRVFHIMFTGVINSAIDRVIEATAAGASWRDVNIGDHHLFPRPFIDDVREHATGRLASLEPSELMFLGFDCRTMVRDAASAALRARGYASRS